MPSGLRVIRLTTRGSGAPVRLADAISSRVGGLFVFRDVAQPGHLFLSRCSIFATDVDPLLSGRNHRSAAQQGRELSDRLDSRINREAQLLRNLGAAALNPKCPQPSRCGADGIPIIRRDEAKLGVGYLQALASE